MMQDQVEWRELGRPHVTIQVSVVRDAAQLSKRGLRSSPCPASPAYCNICEESYDCIRDYELNREGRGMKMQKKCHVFESIR